MSDFYVQLLSNGSTAEFPSNQPNHFKNRMPYPLQFREPGWKVGISAMPLPEAPRKINLKNAFLFRFEWLEVLDPVAGFYYEPLVSIEESDFESTPKTGTELLNMIRDQYLWELNDQAVSDLQLFKKKTEGGRCHGVVLHGHEPRRRWMVRHRQYTDQYLDRDQ